MAILKVAQLGNPVLRKKGEPVPVEDIPSEPIQRLIDDMIDTMREYSGVGLAAPQVHESRQILTLEAEGNPRYSDVPEIELMVLINPKIEKFSNEMDEDWEGCLSLTDIWGKVRRATAITVSAYDREGTPVTIEAEGFLARVLQHEIDHVYGKVFVDRMTDMSTLSFGRERMRYSAHEDEDVTEDMDDQI